MRAFNRVLSGFLAAVLIVLGVLTILEICRAALGEPPAVVQWPKLLPKLRSNSYDDAGPILVCIGVAILGLLILLSGLRRGKPYALPTGSTAPGVRTEINRRSLHRAMHATVLATDRVEGGRVSLHRKSAVIVARANTPTIDGLDAEIRRRIDALLASIALVDPPRLKVKTYPAPPPTTSAPARTPVGVDAAPVQQATPVGAGVSTPASRAVPEPVPLPELKAKSEPEPKAKAEPKANAEPKPLPEPAPLPEPKAKPDAAGPPTARLDDLLSSDREDESP